MLVLFGGFFCGLGEWLSFLVCGKFFPFSTINNGPSIQAFHISFLDAQKPGRGISSSNQDNNYPGLMMVTTDLQGYIYIYSDLLALRFLHQVLGQLQLTVQDKVIFLISACLEKILHSA